MTLVSLLRPALPNTRSRPGCWMIEPAVLVPQGRPPPFGFRASAAATALSGLAKLGACQSMSADCTAASPADQSASSDGSGALPAGKALPDDGASPAQQTMQQQQQQQRQQQQEAADQTALPLRVLAAALADGAKELNASQLAQV